MLVIFATLLSFLAVGSFAFFSSWAHALFWVPFAGIVGLCVGSFLNVVVYRLPLMLERGYDHACRERLGIASPAPEGVFNLCTPHSHCPSCKRLIEARELFPVVSYLALRGKCAGCKTPISSRYPLVELSCGILTAAAVAGYGPTWLAVAVVGFLWASMAAALIDADTFMLPDELCMPLLWAGILAAAGGVGPLLPDAILGVAAGYGVLWAMNKVCYLTQGQEGMGGGDFVYFAACGAFLGWRALACLFLLAGVTGTAYGLYRAVHRAPPDAGRGEAGTQDPGVGQPPSGAIPFGPHLAAAAGVLLLLKPFSWKLGLQFLY